MVPLAPSRVVSRDYGCGGPCMERSNGVNDLRGSAISPQHVRKQPTEINATKRHNSTSETVLS